MRCWPAAGGGGDEGCSLRPVVAIAGGSDVEGPTPAPPAAVDEAAVRTALGTVVDPELGLSITALGLVYGIEVRGGAVRIVMTLTTAGCPLHAIMPTWVREAVRRVPGVTDVDVRLTFDPPWSPERIAR